jgi:Reverse transcriptase (RNA-dependent DNA polymerase)
VYVDDIIITGTQSVLIDALITKLRSKFPIKDLGNLSFFLDIEVHNKDNGLHVSQNRYITNLLSKVHMEDVNPVPSSMVATQSLSKFDGDAFYDPTLYRTIVGDLQYATIIQPDIAFSVNKLSQFMHNPTTAHWAAVKRVIRYLNGTRSHGLTIKPASQLQLHAYCDANWASCPDDRRSTFDYCIFFWVHHLSLGARRNNKLFRDPVPKLNIEIWRL